MKTEFTLPSDTFNRIQVESNLIYVMWASGAAYCGAEAVLEVKTSFVGDGARVKITCRNDKGKKLEALDTQIYGNLLRAPIPIPKKADPDRYVYCEVKLPKHRLEGESNLIPLRPHIQVGKMQWSAKEARRGDVLTLSTEFESDVPDDADAMIVIYEYDQDGNHDPIAKIPVKVKNKRIEIQWEYEYHEDTDEIPTQEELKKYGKTYNPPEYFFVIVLDGVRIGVNQESGLLRFVDKLEVHILKGRRSSRKDERFVVTLADGSSREVKPDANGHVVIEKVVPGRFSLNRAD